MLTELRDALCDELAAWLPHVDGSIRPLVGKRMVLLCGEVSVAIEWLYLKLCVDYVNGLPMTGWACTSLSLPAKLTCPTTTLDSVVEVSSSHNSEIASSVKSSGDLALDAVSWEKSELEF